MKTKTQKQYDKNVEDKNEKSLNKKKWIYKKQTKKIYFRDRGKKCRNELNTKNR